MAKRKIMLTKRDAVLLKLLQDFGVVSTTQINSWVFKSVNRTTVLRRLRRLETAGYIRKRATLPDATAVWVVESSGVQAISGVNHREFYPAHQLPHDMALNDIRWKLYSLQIVKSWMTERDLRRKLTRENRDRRQPKWIVPDALVLFQDFWKENFHARIEIELTLKSDQRYAVLIQKYHERYAKEQVFNWYFVKSEAMGMRILKLAKKHGGFYVEDHFGFTVIDEFLVNPWQSKLMTMKGYYRLGQILKQPEPVKPDAQSDAQGLSRQSEGKTEKSAA